MRLRHGAKDRYNGTEKQDLASSLTRATYSISEDDLQWMILQKRQLPKEFREFEPFREGMLTNDIMAEQGFPGNTAESFSNIGRLTGRMREFANPIAKSLLQDGIDLVAATVVHLFEDDQSVSQWMSEVFVKQFEENVGKARGAGHQLTAARQLEISGFHDEVVGMQAVQEGPNGLASSTVIDFRVGRLLGVAFVVTIGDLERRELTKRLAMELERQIVGVVLGSP